MEGFRYSVAELRHQACKNLPFTNESKVVQDFLGLLSKIFSNRLKTPQNGYWVPAKILSPRYIIDLVSIHCSHKDLNLKSFAWLLLILNEGLLEIVVAGFQQNYHLLQPYYHRNSLLFIEGNQLQDLAHSLETISFVLPWKDSNLITLYSSCLSRAHHTYSVKASFHLDSVSLSPSTDGSSIHTGPGTGRARSGDGSAVSFDFSSISRRSRKLAKSMSNFIKSTPSSSNTISMQVFSSQPPPAHPNLIDFENDAISPCGEKTDACDAMLDPWESILLPPLVSSTPKSFPTADDVFSRHALKVAVLDSPIKVVHKPIKHPNTNHTSAAINQELASPSNSDVVESEDFLMRKFDANKEPGVKDPPAQCCDVTRTSPSSCNTELSCNFLIDHRDLPNVSFGKENGNAIRIGDCDATIFSKTNSQPLADPPTIAACNSPTSLPCTAPIDSHPTSQISHQASLQCAPLTAQVRYHVAPITLLQTHALTTDFISSSICPQTSFTSKEDGKYPYLVTSTQPCLYADLSPLSTALQYSLASGLATLPSYYCAHSVVSSYSLVYTSATNSAKYLLATSRLMMFHHQSTNSTLHEPSSILYQPTIPASELITTQSQFASPSDVGLTLKQLAVSTAEPSFPGNLATSNFALSSTQSKTATFSRDIDSFHCQPFSLPTSEPSHLSSSVFEPGSFPRQLSDSTLDTAASTRQPSDSTRKSVPSFHLPSNCKLESVSSPHQLSESTLIFVSSAYQLSNCNLEPVSFPRQPSVGFTPEPSAPFLRQSLDSKSELGSIKNKSTSVHTLISNFGSHSTSISSKASISRAASSFQPCNDLDQALPDFEQSRHFSSTAEEICDKPWCDFESDVLDSSTTQSSPTSCVQNDNQLHANISKSLQSCTSDSLQHGSDELDRSWTFLEQGDHESLSKFDPHSDCKQTLQSNPDLPTLDSSKPPLRSNYDSSSASNSSSAVTTHTRSPNSSQHVTLQLMLYVLQDDQERIFEVIEVPFQEATLVFTDSFLYIVRFTDEGPLADVSLKISSFNMELLCNDQVLRIFDGTSTSLVFTADLLLTRRIAESVSKLYELDVVSPINEDQRLLGLLSNNVPCNAIDARFVVKFYSERIACHCGLLSHKSSGWMRRWKRSYFVVEKGLLYMYDKKEDDKPAMYVMLVPGCRVTMVSCDVTINTPDEVIRLRCATECEASRWLEAIKHNIVNPLRYLTFSNKTDSGMPPPSVVGRWQLDSEDRKVRLLSPG